MKMNYPPLRSVRGARARGMAALLVGTALIAFFSVFYPRMLREAVYRASAPIWRAEGFVRDTATRLLGHFASKESLIRENEALRLRVADAELLLADRALLAEENGLLTETLGRRSGEKRILAAILATPPRSPYDTVILDAGAADGVAVGDEALAGGSILGAVVTVFAHTAVAELFSTAGVTTPVRILHEGRAVPALAEGMGGGAFVATLPKELPLAKGDAVVAPRAGPLRFAVVEAIVSEPSDSFQTVYFRNPVSVGELRFMEIRRGHGTDPTTEAR